MEVGEREIIYFTNRYTVTTRFIPTLRWAAMRAIVTKVAPRYVSCGLIVTSSSAGNEGSRTRAARRSPVGD